MKASKREQNELSRALDKASEGLDAIIEMYNELEEDKPIINLDDQVIKELEKARGSFGEEFIDRKLNSLIKEALSWLSADQEDESS
ncbi:atypical membrane-integrating protein (Mistic protein) [Alkalihalobacillus sp. AL-G]|uniref:atypical membrane-integrating protein (Mistic protein) n=1 Tax=Alkalihalobacillus sp. AL-G TaxID=2926399 RepID=UPI00272CADB9|nr:atypical membrane-integrating protein (Mistic protein) [Alkalihalobacillus sp. AL-G]WLD94780.1 atypical membrane-integrating protein (Mistic protein) [Alkalihalobacillus sp. AL-G]